MNIELSAPVFRCREEEAIFYERLSALAGCEKVVVCTQCVAVTIGDDCAARALDELGEICAIWNLSFERVSGRED